MLLKGKYVGLGMCVVGIEMLILILILIIIKIVNNKYWNIIILVVMYTYRVVMTWSSYIGDLISTYHRRNRNLLRLLMKYNFLLNVKIAKTIIMKIISMIMKNHQTKIKKIQINH